MFRRAVASIALVVPLLLMASPVHAQSNSGCQFILGFATLHAMDPSDVGDCVDDQAYGANGDALQHTTGGLLVWRKADNFTAFTDGTHTWVNGPNGLAERLNTQRFSWEANPDGLPVVSDLTTAQKLHFAGNIALQIVTAIWTNDVESYNENADVPADSFPPAARSNDTYSNMLMEAPDIGSYAQIDANHYKYDVMAAGKVFVGFRLAPVTFHWFILMNIDSQKGHLTSYLID